MFKYSSAALVSLALAIGPAPEARADGDAVAGFIVGLGVGAIAGAAAQKQQQKRKATSTSRKSKSTYKKPVSSAKRGDAQVQVALNYYNFEAGTPDGVFGPGTRSAIRRYQSYIGEPATGELTGAQTTALLSAYARDTAGDSNGLFAGNRTASGNAQMSTLLASLGSQGTNDLAPATPEPALATTTTEALPAAGPAEGDLCKAPAAVATKGPGTATPAETIVNSYCSAVGYAVQNSVTLTKAVQGFDPAVSGKQCADWLVANRAKLDAALAKAPEQTVADLAALVPGAAEPQRAAMRDSFSICHGIAQAAGNAPDARAFAALVAAFGGVGYGELVAASDALGLGTMQSGQAANAWYLWTAEAIDGGGQKLITTADYDHVPLLLALADSSLEMTGDWKAYLASANAPAPAGGLALPGLATASAPAVSTESALPANFEQTYGMTTEQALTACRQGGAAMADLGRITCRSLAVSAGDSLLAAQYQ